MKTKNTIRLLNAGILVGASCPAQADLYQFDAQMTINDQGQDLALRFSILGNGDLTEDPFNPGVEEFQFSALGNLEYELAPNLWVVVGALDVDIAYWPSFAWPQITFTSDPTNPFPLPVDLGSSWSGVISGTDIGDGWDGNLLSGSGDFTAGNTQIAMESWQISLVPAPGALGLILICSVGSRRRRLG